MKFKGYLKQIIIGGVIGIGLTFAWPTIAQVGGNLWFLSGGEVRPNVASWGLRIPALTDCDTIDTDSDGSFACGTDSSGSGGSAAWHEKFTNAITPTSTTAGIFVNASSTFDSQLRVNGALYASSTVLIDGTVSLINNDIILQGTSSDIRSDTDLDLYPGNQVTRGLRVSDGTTDVAISATGSNSITVNDSLIVNGVATSTKLSVIESLENGDDGVLIDIDTTGSNNIDTINGIKASARDGSSGEATSINGIYGLARNQSGPATTTSVRGVYGQGRNDSSSGIVDELYGVFGNAINNSSGTTTDFYGVAGFANNVSTGYLERAYGGYFYTENQSTGTINAAHGVYIGDITVDDGTVNTDYGLYIENINSGTTNYAIRTNTGLVSFGDSVYAPQIVDSNGNEIVIFSTTASAVNEFTISNGASGSFPTLSATGDNANIPLALQVKGNGTYRLLGTASQASEVRLHEDTSNGGNYVAITPAQSISSNVTLTLPSLTGTFAVTGASQAVSFGAATTTNLAVTGLTAASCDVKSTTDGVLFCGTDSDSGGAGASNWNALFTNALTPTNTSAGIFVNASSTFNGQLGIRGTLYASSTILAADGSASVPEYSFGSDPDTGFFRVGSDTLGFTSAGTERVRFTSGGISLQGSVTQIKVLELNNPGFPDITGNTDTNTGILWGGSDALALVTGGVRRMLFDTASSTITTTLVVSNNATTTGSLALTNYQSCTALETDTNGLVVCGSDDSGGAGAAAWEQLFTNALTPTSSTSGIFVNASSSLQATTTLATNGGNVKTGRLLQVGNPADNHFVPSGGDGSGFVIIDKPNAASDSSLLLASEGDLKWEIGTAGDDNLQWKTITGTESGGYTFTNTLFMDYATARVGVGTEQPSSKFEIASSSPTARVDMRVTNKATTGTDGTSLQLVAENDNHVFYVGTDAGLNGGQNAFLNWGAFGTGIFIDAASNVGINDTSLTYDLEVGGDVLFGASATTTATMHIGQLELAGDYVDSLTADATLALASGNLQVVDVTCTDCLSATEITDIYVLLAGDSSSGNYVWSGVHDFGGGVLEIPNGTAPVLDAIGEIGFDTSGNQLLVATSTDAAGAAVVGRALDRIYGMTIASSTPLVSGHNIIMPTEVDGFTVKHIQCRVGNGTSVAITLSDGTNATNSVTCTTTGSTQHAITSNGTFTASENIRLQLGANTASVEQLSISVYGTWTRE